jgi:drug/metabolite transporter (DMT)-like permease
MSPPALFIVLDVFAALALIIIGIFRSQIGIALTWVVLAAIIFGVCTLIADSFSRELPPSLVSLLDSGSSLFSAIALFLGFIYVCKKQKQPPVA